MAVKLRLVRMGKKKQPTYRVVAADTRSPRDGRFLEIVGTYAPRGSSTAEPDAVIKIDNAKAVKWLVDGAQPTERVERLLNPLPHFYGRFFLHRRLATECAQPRPQHGTGRYRSRAEGEDCRYHGYKNNDGQNQWHVSSLLSHT